MLFMDKLPPSEQKYTIRRWLKDLSRLNEDGRLVYVSITFGVATYGKVDEQLIATGHGSMKRAIARAMIRIATRLLGGPDAVIQLVPVAVAEDRAPERQNTVH